MPSRRSTLTHNDSTSTKLAVTGCGIAAVDCGHAETPPPLGDRGTLLHAPVRHRVAASAVRRPYLTRHPVADSAWHIQMSAARDSMGRPTPMG